MERPSSISSYLTTFSNELGARILESFQPLYGPDDPPSPLLSKLLRRPFPAQRVAICGIARRLAQARSAAAVAECGTGKTLIALASIFVAAQGQPFTALACVPNHLTLKWCREGLWTIPRLRVFLIDGLRDARSSSSRTGIHEVKLRRDQIVRDGLKMTLSELRLRKNYPTARARWDAICPQPALFVCSKDTLKLGSFWRHAYATAGSGRYQGSVVNPDTGEPIYDPNGDRLLAVDFKHARRSEWIGESEDTEEPDLKARRKLFSALWQADGRKVRRAAVIDFISRHLRNFFDFVLADEVHELKGADTAQGNALGTLASAAKKTIVLTGTLLGGYADDAYEILFRLHPHKMIERGFEHEGGVRPFMETYGLLETITTIEPRDNACSEARVTRRVRRRPGASPQLFGDFLMPRSSRLRTLRPPYRLTTRKLSASRWMSRLSALTRSWKVKSRTHCANTGAIRPSSARA